MNTWRRVLPQSRFIEIQYEALVANQERESRRLVEFCGLPWNDACLNFHTNAAPVATASSVQVRSPIYSPLRRSLEALRRQARRTTRVVR